MLNCYRTNINRYHNLVKSREFSSKGSSSWNPEKLFVAIYGNMPSTSDVVVTTYMRTGRNPKAGSPDKLSLGTQDLCVNLGECLSALVFAVVV